ncbi:hypothetical protein C9374_009449 [Naegleria lovaniensis]|uniref:MD-2-related lipid-recognition domain-containing protein n=1 Tax=Naegleria lovaniensis TaxID=51637 RepID=A0AA88KR27_NAELO|nr:uncharacterized protein C9374_009449 [Naegleria lovaniensis]KAG2392872.1 hypothetical protein C9374_009449 [Naegleria lovaniensis]
MMKLFVCAVVVVLMATLMMESVFAQDPLTWSICKRYPKQTLQITSVSLNPNPPQAGNNLQVTIQGDLTEPMAAGSTGQVSVNYAGTPMYTGPFDPCQFLAGSSNQCPLSKGQQTLSITQQITPMAPSGGPYQGTIVITDQNKNIVSCIDFNFMMM